MIPLLLLASCQLFARVEAKRTDSVGAVGIRDHVPRYQKMSTRLYTKAFFEASYPDHNYIVEGSRNDRRTAQLQFKAALEGALARNEAVDLFLLAHGNRYIDWVEKIDPQLRSKIRMVYNTGAGDADQGRQWLALGAKAYVGHPYGDNIAPVFYYYFLPQWTKDVPLDEAVAEANRRTREDLLEGTTGWMIDMVEDGDAAEQLWQATQAGIYGDRTLTLTGDDAQ